MRLVRACVILVSVALLAAGSGCSHEQRDWHSAQAANTIEAYEQFISAHPKSARAADAQARISQLAEERDWQRASTADTADAYRQFLAQHPQGRYAPEGRIRVENFGMTGTGAAPAPGSAPPPRGTPPAPATAAPAATAEAPAGPSAGTYAVQLGAYTSKAKAQSEWRRLSARFAAELHGTSPDIREGKSGSGRRVYRLQAKPFTEARARSICAVLRKRAQACVMVHPRR